MSGRYKIAFTYTILKLSVLKHGAICHILIDSQTHTPLRLDMLHFTVYGFLGDIYPEHIESKNQLLCTV